MCVCLFACIHVNLLSIVSHVTITDDVTLSCEFQMYSVIRTVLAEHSVLSNTVIIVCTLRIIAVDKEAILCAM